MLGTTSRATSKLFAAALATLALVVTGSVSATAAPAPAVNDATLVEIGKYGTLADVKRLSPAERTRFIELSQVASVEEKTSTEFASMDGEEALSLGYISVPEGEFAPMAVVCRIGTRTLESRNALGDLLHTRTLQIQICGDTAGTPITGHSVASAYATVYWVTWQFNGVTGQGSSLVASNRANQFAQYSFTMLIGPLNYLYCVSLDSSGINSFGNIVLYATPTTRCGV